MDWWLGLPKWLKFGFAFLVLGAAVAELIWAHTFRVWTWAIGLVLLFFAPMNTD